MTRLRRTLILACVALAMAGCTAGGQSAQPEPSSSDAPTGAVSSTRPTTPRSTILTTPVPKLTTPAATAPEVDGACPYISNSDFHDYEGDMVGRVTLIQTRPVGCRFYFAYQPDQIIGEVYLQTFPNSTNANNAMVASSDGHPERQSSATIGNGAIAYRTALQGADTWQCVVTVGNRVYTVRTRQDRPSLAIDAFNLAAALVATVTKAK